MLTIERRVGGLLRYRKIWFPPREAAFEISRSLKANETARLFGASWQAESLPGLIKSRQSLTSWISLAGGPEKILEGMKRKSCRYEIRRAEKMQSQVDIEVGSARSHRDFLILYNDFARAKQLPKFPAAWIKEYAPHSEIIVLYLRGEPLCCHLLLCDPETSIVRLLYSGSRRLETADDASACGALNRYLHWYEMQRYHSKGFATFDFGGIRSTEDPISRFKLSFGGTIVTEHYCLLGGTQWIAKLGNLMYEKFLRRSTFTSQDNDRGPGAQ